MCAAKRGTMPSGVDLSGTPEVLIGLVDIRTGNRFRAVAREVGWPDPARRCYYISRKEWCAIITEIGPWHLHMRWDDGTQVKPESFLETTEGHFVILYKSPA